MEFSSTLTNGTDQFIAGLSQAMQAEQQFARIVSQIIPSICSAEVSDETATAVFLQELSEQLFMRQFPDQKFST